MAPPRAGKKQKRFNKTLMTPPFRGAFVHLLEPEETDHGDRYQLTALFPPKADIKELEDTLYEAMEADFGDEADWPSGKNDVLPDDKLYDAGKKKYAGFIKGWLAMSMSSTEMPGIVDADRNEVVNKREVYGGRWMRAQVNVTTYDNKSAGVGVYINHVQLLDHDEAFSGRGNAEDAFDKYELKDTGRRRGKEDEDDDDRNERGSRSRSRDDEDRGSRRGKERDEDTRDRGRGRSSREDDEDDRSSSRGRGRDRDRDEDDARDTRGEGRSRGRGRDGEDEGSRSRDRDEGSSDRGSSRRGSRDRDEETADEKPRGRSRSRDDADDGERSTSRSRSRTDDDDRDDTRSSRSSGRNKRDDDDWN